MARVIKVGQENLGGGEFAPIPVGAKVRVAVYDLEEGVSGPNSQKPGTPQFQFTAKVTEDFEWVDETKGPQNAKGREIRYNYITLDPGAKGAWALAAFAEAVGWDVDRKTGDITLPDDLREVLGTEFIAKIGHSTGQDGKSIYNRVTGYQKIKAGGGEQAPAKKSWSDL